MVVYFSPNLKLALLIEVMLEKPVFSPGWSAGNKAIFGIKKRVQNNKQTSMISVVTNCVFTDVRFKSSIFWYRGSSILGKIKGSVHYSEVWGMRIRKQ